MKIAEFEATHSLEQVKELARQKGISSTGTKRDIAKRLLAKEKHPRPPLTHYRNQAHQSIEDVSKAIDETKKSESIKRIERTLSKLDAKILEHEVITNLNDLRDAIEDYKAITREGLTPEEYTEEKESAFEAITDATEGLDIDEDALESLEEENETPEHFPQTSLYYTISYQGDTTFKPGGIVSELAFKKENERVTKLRLRPARGWITSKGELRSRANGWRPTEERDEYESQS